MASQPPCGRWALTERMGSEGRAAAGEARAMCACGAQPWGGAQPLGGARPSGGDDKRSHMQVRGTFHIRDFKGNVTMYVILIFFESRASHFT